MITLSELAKLLGCELHTSDSALVSSAPRGESRTAGAQTAAQTEAKVATVQISAVGSIGAAESDTLVFAEIHPRSRRPQPVRRQPFSSPGRPLR